VIWDIPLARCWVYSARSLLRDGNQLLGRGYIAKETERRLASDL
jgi:hypothetical protein